MTSSLEAMPYADRDDPHPDDRYEIDLADRPLANAESIIQELRQLRGDSDKTHTTTVLYDSEREGGLMAQIEDDRVIEITDKEQTARVLELKVAAAFYGEPVRFVKHSDESNGRQTISCIFEDGFTVSTHRQPDIHNPGSGLRSVQVEAGYTSDLEQAA